MMLLFSNAHASKARIAAIMLTKRFLKQFFNSFKRFIMLTDK
jgi:hypothetical protein